MQNNTPDHAPRSSESPLLGELADGAERACEPAGDEHGADNHAGADRAGTHDGGRESGHGHGHGHGPGHSHVSTDTNRRRLIIAIAIVGTVLIAEAVGAWLTGSLALLADAGHMASDLIGLIVALSATIIAARPATDRHTYGFQRTEVFGALINSVILLGVAAFVAVEAIGRLLNPESVDIPAVPLIIVAGVGLVANFAALMLLRGGAKSSINMRGAYLEVFGDLLGSIAVIIAGVLILTVGFEAADSLASLAIATMIVPRAAVLLRDVFRVLSQQAPRETDVQEIRRHILSKDGVVDVHDVHVWAVTTGKHIFSAHVVCEESVFEAGNTDHLLDELTRCMSGHFDVEHSTFQLEPVSHAAHETDQHA